MKVAYCLDVVKIGRWGTREHVYKMFPSKQARQAYLSRYGGTIRYVKAKKFIANIEEEKEN